MINFHIHYKLKKLSKKLFPDFFQPSKDLYLEQGGKIEDKNRIIHFKQGGDGIIVLKNGIKALDFFKNEVSIPKIEILSAEKQDSNFNLIKKSPLLLYSDIFPLQEAVVENLEIPLMNPINSGNTCYINIDQIARNISVKNTLEKKFGINLLELENFYEIKIKNKEKFLLGPPTYREFSDGTRISWDGNHRAFIALMYGAHTKCNIVNVKEDTIPPYAFSNSDLVKILEGEDLTGIFEKYGFNPTRNDMIQIGRNLEKIMSHYEFQKENLGKGFFKGLTALVDKIPLNGFKKVGIPSTGVKSILSNYGIGSGSEGSYRDLYVKIPGSSGPRS